MKMYACILRLRHSCMLLHRFCDTHLHEICTCSSTCSSAALLHDMVPKHLLQNIIPMIGSNLHLGWVQLPTNRGCSGRSISRLERLPRKRPGAMIPRRRRRAEAKPVINPIVTVQILVFFFSNHHINLI